MEGRVLCGLSCERRRLQRPPMTPGNPNVHFGWAVALNRGHNSTNRLPEREKKERNLRRERETKRAKFWAVQRRSGPAQASPAEERSCTSVVWQINTSETRIRRRWADTARSLTRPLTHLLTHSLTDSLTHSLSLAHSLTHSLTHSPHSNSNSNSKSNRNRNGLLGATPGNAPPPGAATGY